MQQLGHGLSNAECHEDALSVQDAELSTLRRIGVPDGQMLVAQSNIANTYDLLGRFEEALSMRQDTYSRWLKLKGDAHEETLREATSCAITLSNLHRYAEAKALLRKMIPVARRVLAESDDLQFRMRMACNRALCEDPAKTLDDLREAVSMLEEIEPTARRVLGGAHPIVEDIERRLPASRKLRDAQVALCAQVGDDVSSLREAMEAMASWTPDAIAAAAEKQGR